MKLLAIHPERILSNEMTINFYVLSPSMKDWIGCNMQGCLTVVDQFYPPNLSNCNSLINGFNHSGSYVARAIARYSVFAFDLVNTSCFFAF